MPVDNQEVDCHHTFAIRNKAKWCPVCGAYSPDGHMGRFIRPHVNRVVIAARAHVAKETSGELQAVVAHFDTEAQR